MGVEQANEAQEVTRVIESYFEGFTEFNRVLCSSCSFGFRLRQ